MARYIDADALKRRIYASPIFFHFGEDGFFIRDAVLDLIDKFPAEKTTADVVEVVRCKDCKCRALTEEGEFNPEDIVCDYFMTDGMQANDFCSYGEKALKEREKENDV